MDSLWILGGGGGWKRDVVPTPIFPDNNNKKSNSWTMENIPQVNLA